MMLSRTWVVVLVILLLLYDTVTKATYRREFLCFAVPEGWVHRGRRAQQQEQEAERSHLHHEYKAETMRVARQCDLTVHQQWHASSRMAAPQKPPPNSASNWEPRIQTLHQHMWDLFIQTATRVEWPHIGFKIAHLPCPCCVTMGNQSLDFCALWFLICKLEGVITLLY